MFKQILLSGAAAALLGLAACSEDNPMGPVVRACDPLLNSFTAISGDTTTTASGLKYLDVRTGTGTTAQSGTVANVHYSGYLLNGTRFDSSCERQETLFLQVGGGGVIPGFDQGVSGMRIGGIRRLIIPPALGYGNRPAGTIPPNSTIIFDVQLITAR